MGEGNGRSVANGERKLQLSPENTRCPVYCQSQRVGGVSQAGHWEGQAMLGTELQAEVYLEGQLMSEDVSPSASFWRSHSCLGLPGLPGTKAKKKHKTTQNTHTT